MSNYTALVGDKTIEGSIKNWINWNKAPSETILSEAEAFIYSQLRIREMRKLVTGTILLNATTLNMPANYIEAMSFKRTGNTAGRIEVLDEPHFEDKIALDENSTYMAGAPTKCMIIDEPAVAHFDCKADQDIPYRLVYYARPDALSVSNLTNWLTQRYPMVVRATCLGFANHHYKNFSEADKWLNMASGLITSANAEADQARQITRIEHYWDT